MKTVVMPDPWTCPECGERVEHKLVPVVLAGRFLGHHPVRVCGEGHEIMDAEIVARLWRQLELDGAIHHGRPRA